jgi:tRNA/tmRNA/rRNA uracil-C5-methylase (TrmA/RlmC/RlmD family)
MSVVTLIIKRLRRKKPQMEIENPPVFTPNTHPVLQALNEKVATLEAEVQKFKDEAFKEAQLRRETFVAKLQYEERVKNVLVEALEDYDEDTVKHIAEQLNITLTKTKSVEVNVTFTIDLEYEIGDEPDLDWDLEFDVRHDSIVDYQTDIVYSKDV